MLCAGALGAALVARGRWEQGFDSAFKGFDAVLSSSYSTVTTVCTQAGCHRRCDRVVALLENGTVLAGYRSVDCSFAHFSGLAEDPAQRAAHPGHAEGKCVWLKVGFVEAFTGHYRSSRMIARFLELMGVEVVRSGITTPAILEAGTTLASADFCVPLRVYVGHVHRLLADHPDLDFLLAPNVLSEDGKSSTCAKLTEISAAWRCDPCGRLPITLQRRPAVRPAVRPASVQVTADSVGFPLS